MVGIIALVTALFFSLVVARLAATALVLTGMSEEAARFQALSAFTGTGFTTGEAESVVRHPVRRRIMMVLMVLHSAGVVTIVASLILTFVGTHGTVGPVAKLGWLAVGMGVFVLVARSKLVDRQLSQAIHWALRRWTDLDTRDYVSLLNLAGKYTVREMQVAEGDWLAGKDLKSCRLPDMGITVLGIYRGTEGYVGVPTAHTRIDPRDVLVLYGHADALQELDRLRAGPAGNGPAGQPVSGPDQGADGDQTPRS